MSFSISLWLEGAFPGVLVIGLITFMALWSRAALIILSAAGLTPFTGDVTELSFVDFGVLMTDVFSLLSLSLDLFGDNVDLSLNDSASLSSSLSALDLTGLLLDLPNVTGYAAINRFNFDCSSSVLV